MAANITVLPSAKVPLIYDGTTLMSNEWYRFFWNIYGFTGTGAIPASKGGTGYTSYTNGQLLIGNSSGALTASTLTPSTGIGITNGDGSITIANTGVTSLIAGTGVSVSSATGAVTVANTGVLSFSASTTGLTPSTPTTGAIVLGGTLNVTNGGTGQTTYTNGQLLIGNTTGNTLSKATLTAGANITITNGPGTITIASSGGASGVTAVTGTAPIASSGGTTPAISISQATTSTNGYLSSTDWNTFNNKGSGTVTSVSGTGSVNGITLTGTVTSSGSITLGGTLGSIANSQLTNSSITINGTATSLGGSISVGTVTSVTGTTPVVSSGGTTPAISMAAANTTTNGYLTSTDWNTFNGKGSGTVTSVSVVTANGFAGTVATATSTPAITLTTSITGILKGNATAISAATSGTDYAPGTSANTSGLVYSTTTTGALTTATGAQVSTALGSTAITGNAANVTGIVLGANGGTGVANTGFTITVAGNVSHAGSFTQTFTATGNTSLTLPTTGTLATLAGTETLTNKWIQPRVLASTANSGTPTLNTDNYDMMVITGQSATITNFSTNLTGTPVNGQKLWIAITGTGAIGITWGTSFESSTVTLPSTTVTTARLDVGFVWNVATSKWRCVATA